jgi:hypothetical protein
VSAQPYAYAARPHTTTAHAPPPSPFDQATSGFADGDEDAMTLVGAESATAVEFTRGPTGGDKRPRSAAILARTQGRTAAGAGVVQVVPPPPSHGPTAASLLAHATHAANAAPTQAGVSL